ncbi:MAG: glycoside hydrolase family 9, partial [Verrucomicrobiota bacterium]|nr:glycoside hydrolase family 9 [Verrucomicrobiota bacterium]
DGDEKNAYPFYDRWGDSFNTSGEFVTVNIARGLGCLTFLMAQTSLKTQAWKPVSAQIIGLPDKLGFNKSVTVQIQAPGFDLNSGRTVWESADHEPVILPGKKSFVFTPSKTKAQWLEAETLLPDGRRFFAVTNFNLFP